jgi:hypothetical protein
MPVILATWEAEIGRKAIQGQSKQIICKIPISKITRAKWIGGMPQAVECVFYKPRALSSNPRSMKKKRILREKPNNL